MVRFEAIVKKQNQLPCLPYGRAIKCIVCNVAGVGIHNGACLATATSCTWFCEARTASSWLPQLIVMSPMKRVYLVLWMNSRQVFTLSFSVLKHQDSCQKKFRGTSVLRTFTSLIKHHSSYTTHHTPLIIHHLSVHHSSLHHSSYTTHHTPLIIHHSSYTSDHPVISSFKSSSSR